MQTVRDSSGRTYLLVKRSGDASKVRDPETGEETYLDNDQLTVVDGEPALETAARAVPAPVRRVLSACPNDRALGLLVELHERGPLSVRQLLDAYDLCESDLHGLLAEFRAAGLVAERDVFGDRGYGVTDSATEALETLTAEETTAD